jgi:hypothetical protein
MEAMKLTILNKALAMLRATGSKYAVIDCDGNKYGELEIVEPKARKKHVRSGIHFKPMFIDKISKVVPGEEIHVFTPPEGIPIENYRSAMCGYASQNWGNGTYSTEIKDNTVQLMRWS